MKKIFVFFVFLITFPLFSEKIHFRLVKNQDKYDFIKNSEFYFDTQEDDISFYRDNYSFRETSLDTTINGYRKSILINDIELFENNAIFPDSIKDSVWTLKNYLDDIRYNKNTLFINEPFWKKTWTQISVADYDEQGRDYFAPVTLKVFNACLCFDPNLVFDTTNVIFKSIKKETASYLIEGYVVDNYDTGYPFIYEYFPYKSKVIYELVLDGDYLYFCHHDKILLTFVRTKEEMQYEIINYYRNEKCDKSKFTWPRHSDGTCDYEDVSSVKTVSTSTTNVTPNKTMTVSENLKLRSAEATTSEVLTVMSAGTKVKITGTNTYIDVEIDGRTARIAGEMIVGGFVCYKSSMKNWLVPENEPLTEDDKNEIIQKVTEKTAGSHMVITFE